MSATKRFARRTTKTPPIWLDQASGKLCRWKGVVKMQQSLNTGPKMILVYDETRMIMGQFEAKPEHLELMGEELKIYIEVIVFEDGSMEVIDRVEEQDW